MMKRTFRKKNELVGPRVLLKQTSVDHTKGLYDQLISPGVMENLTIDIENIEDFRRYIIFIVNQWRMNQDFTYTVFLQDGLIIGQISLYNVSFVHNRGEIGIWLGNQYWKAGYGKEILHLIIEYAFQHLYLNRVEAHIFTHNSRSIELFEKFGFQNEGVNHQYVIKNGKYVDVFLLAYLKENYDSLTRERK